MNKLTGAVSLIIPIGIGLPSGPMATDDDGLALFQFIGMEKKRRTDLPAKHAIRGLSKPSGDLLVPPSR